MTTSDANPASTRYNLSGPQLEGKTALVVGGTGNVGYYLVDGFLRAGADVLVPTRSQENFERLRSRLDDDYAGNITPLIGDLGTPEGAAALGEQVRSLDVALSAVAIAAGGWHMSESTLQAGFDEFRGVVETRLYPHFLAAETFIPLLEEEGAYIMINGPVAFLDQLPAGLGAIAAALAAQNKLMLVVASETQGKPRVNDVVMWAYIGPDGTLPQSTLDGEEVGSFVAALAGSTGRAVHGRTIQLRTAEQVQAALNGDFGATEKAQGARRAATGA